MRAIDDGVVQQVLGVEHHAVGRGRHPKKLRARARRRHAAKGRSWQLGAEARAILHAVEAFELRAVLIEGGAVRDGGVGQHRIEIEDCGRSLDPIFAFTSTVVIVMR